ncbi:MAG: hypothetical protein KBS94_00900 [Prevotella sp.]|nr:hypothetical protein [Candidatus Equicola faecalis]
MKYSLVKRKDPRKKDGEAKIYACPQSHNTIKFMDLAESMRHRMISYDPGTIMGVVDVLTQILKEKLQAGFNVELGGLGTFRFAFDCEGLPESANIPFDPHKQIKSIRTCWEPSETLRELKEEKMDWHKADSRVEQRRQKRMLKRRGGEE